MNKLPKTLAASALATVAAFLISCAFDARNDGSKASAAPATQTETVLENVDTSAETAAGETIKITVSIRYEPKSIEVKKGQPVKLAFYRPDDKNCGGEIVFPKLGIRRELPVGKTVIVEFTPQESGEISFTCGMNMMRGKIIVQ